GGIGTIGNSHDLMRPAHRMDRLAQPCYELFRTLRTESRFTHPRFHTRIGEIDPGFAEEGGQLAWCCQWVFTRHDAPVHLDAAVVGHGVDASAPFNPADAEGRWPE